MKKLIAALSLMDLDMECEGLSIWYIELDYDKGFCEFSDKQGLERFRIDLDNSLLLTAKMDLSVRSSYIWCRGELIDKQDEIFSIFNVRKLKMPIWDFTKKLEDEHNEI